MENSKEMRTDNHLKKVVCAILLSMACSTSAFSTCTAAIAYSYPVGKNICQQDTIAPKNNAGSIIDPPTKPVDPDTIIGPITPDEPINPYIRCSVGTPNGVLDVSNSGAAVYNLIFEVPNGGSLTPQIGISYNSQSGGYGLAGFGFNITGISAITRGGKDLFHDGIQAGVTYTSSDNLFIDGKRMILQSGTAGQDGAVYTVEGDPFTKIVVHGNYNNTTTTTWFEVTNNTGITYQYGNSTNSKIAYKNKKGYSRIASWYVNKATDRYSNYITYDYAVSNLSIRPTTVTYGTNSVKSRGIVNKISFEYQSLGENVRPFSIEDQQGKTSLCLSSVTSTCNGSVYRKYTFTYNGKSDQSYGKWTRLVKVEVENSDGEKYPPVKFNWQYLPSGSVQAGEMDVSTDFFGLGNVEEKSKQFFAADLNNDGVSDIIRVAPVVITSYDWLGGTHQNHTTYLYVNKSQVSSSGDVTYDTPLIFNLLSSESLGDLKQILGGYNVMDFDGDGYNDMVFQYYNSASDLWNQVAFQIVWGSDVAFGRTIVNDPFAVNLKSVNELPLLVTFDVDSDGKDDIVCLEQCKKDGGYPCTIVQYTGRTELNFTLPQGVNKKIEKLFVGDYNNDGLSDLILLYDGGYKIYFNNGGVTVAERFTEVNTKSGTDFGNNWRIQQGDFDGDGLSDFIYYKSGESYLYIAHNNGDGTFSHTQTPDIGVADHASNKDDSRFAINVCDFDHDGRSDVMVCKAGYDHRGFPNFENVYTDTQVRWLYSTGSNLKLTRSYTKNREDDAKESYIFTGDFDGDGYLELANYGSNLNSTSNIFDEKINVYKSSSNLQAIGKIIKIYDGLDNGSNIEYASATNPNVYRKSIKSAYPVNTYTLPLSVVAKVRRDNGSTGKLITNYSYEDLRLHIAGKGMLGFNTVTSENTTLGTKETSSITKWDESLWIPTETKTLSSVGNDTATVVSTFTISKADNNYFAYISKKEVTDLDGNTATTITNYDVAKGVVADETVMNDGYNMYKKVIYSGYQKKGGVWLPSTLVMSQKHSDAPSQHSTVTTYSYDDKGNVLTQTENTASNMALTTTSTYDAYGNVLSSVTTGNGVKAITKHNVYDPSGRFVVKSYTSPASAVNTFTYDLWGNMLTESDETEPSNILTTEYDYDGWGRMIYAWHADGTSTSYDTGWGTSDSKKYYTTESTTAKPDITIWYDKGGKEVLRETVGVKGVGINKTTTYNSKGQVSHIENKTGNLTITQELTYDERGRVATDVSSTGKSTSYSYGNRSVTTTTAGRSYTTTTDAWGNIVKSTDPISEVEYTYSSIGKPSSVETDGSIVTMTYDVAGNQLSLSDPDAGTTTYTYAADGTLLTQTDARGIKTTNNYDNLGRLASTQIGQKTIVYTYGTTGYEKLRLTKKSLDNNSVEYAHDNLGRVITEVRNMGGNGTYTSSYAYNDDNQLASTTYPGGLEVAYQYDEYGYKTQAAVGDKVIYKLESADGLVSSSSFLGQLTATRTRDSQGYERNLRISKGTAVLENFVEEYNSATGNLMLRRRNNEPLEQFGYDNLDRLTSVRNSETGEKIIDYSPNGNIINKTGVGRYFYYSNFQPHAVAEVYNNNTNTLCDNLTTSFNELGKIQTIDNEAKGTRMFFAYGPDRERWLSTCVKNNSIAQTTIYAGNFERIIENGTAREFYYLDGNTIVVRENGKDYYFLAFTDNIGSILSVMDINGTKFFDATYDAWGKQTVRRNTIGLHRGYTGHEMLNDFDIINMNGRLYDPVIGRFLSPDNYVQMPNNSQNFNRYSYCLNNPLKYTDPSGEWFGIDDLIIAGVGFVAGYLSNSITTGNWGMSSVKNGLIGTVVSWLGYNTGGYSASSITNTTWEYSAKICINNFANKALPSLTVPISNNFAFSLSPTFGLGTDGFVYGALGGLAMRFGDVSINLSEGITNNYYGWNATASYDGWGLGFGKTYYNEDIVRGNTLGKQTVGTITALLSKDVSFRLSNDMFGKNHLDRWRTSAAELSIGEFSVGTYVTTNWGAKESGPQEATIKEKTNYYRDDILGYNPYNSKGIGGSWKKGDIYTAPFWFGYNHNGNVYRFGYSHNYVQSLTQNAVHKYLVKTPYFLGKDNFYKGLFIYNGYNNPLSLW